MMKLTGSGVMACWLLAVSVVIAEDKLPVLQSISLRPAELGSTPNVHAFGATLLCGQPTAADLAAAKARGIKVVVTLREEGEVKWDEAAAAKELGLEFHQFGFRTAESLTDDILGDAVKVLKDAQKQPVLLHCGSANRVGAIWAAHRVLNDGISVDAALEEADQVGLRTDAYRQKVRDYIGRKKQP